MKKQYENPNCTLIMLQTSDVITLSGFSLTEWMQDGGLKLGNSDFWGSED